MSVKILAKNDESLKSVLHDTALFKNLSEDYQRFRYPWNGLFRREKKYHRYV